MKLTIPPASCSHVLEAFYDEVCRHLSRFPSPLHNGMATFELADAPEVLQGGSFLPHPLRDPAPGSRYMRSWGRVIAADAACLPAPADPLGRAGPAEVRWLRLVAHYLPHHTVPPVYLVAHRALTELCHDSGLCHGHLEVYPARPRLSVWLADSWKCPHAGRHVLGPVLHGVRAVPPLLPPVVVHVQPLLRARTAA